MEQKVIISEHQQGTTTDANNFGQFPRDTFDHIIEDLGPGFKYTGFSTTITATTKVTVGAGRLYGADGPLYFNADAGGTELDFIASLPSVGKRIAAVVAWGSEIETLTQPRTFVTNAQTRETEARVTSTVSRRHASIQAVLGVSGPDPARPLVPSNYLTVCWVTLNTTGVESVVMEENNRAASIEDLEADILDLDTWRILFGQQLETFATMLAALAARIGNLATMDMMMRVIVDVTRLKERNDLPDSYSAWGSDYFLDETESDTTHPDYLARIEEGLRFPHAAERVAALALNNPIDSNVVLHNSTFMLPAYHEVKTLANVATALKTAKTVPYSIRVVEYTKAWVYGDNGWRYHTVRDYYTQYGYKTIFVETGPKEISISQFSNQTFGYARRYPVRHRVRWGWPYYRTSRYNFWWDQRHDPIWWTFRRISGDSAFVILDGPPYYVLPAPGIWSWTYKWYRNRWFWWDRVVDYHYWDRVRTTHSVNGSVVSQTFLNSQDTWLTGAHFFFTRKGAAGDVTVLLCETTEQGQPNPNAVLAVSADIPPSDMNIWPYATRAWFPPTHLQGGKRYVYIFITSGAHYLATTEQNQLTHGTMFYSTDSAWFQGFGDMTRDIAFENICAEFDSTRYEVQLAATELSGGIAAIDVLADAQVPEGTSLTFEVQINGAWVGLTEVSDAETEHPLSGLPPLLNFRAVFQGTQALMPALSIGNASQVYTWRGRSDFKHLSEVRTMPSPVDTVYVTTRFEAWRGSPHHSVDVTLLTGTQVASATVQAGGSGHNVGNHITLSNGVVLNVETINSGAITGVSVLNPGNVAIGGTEPTNPVAQVSTTGAGINSTFNLTWQDAIEAADVTVETPAPEDDGSLLDTSTIIRKYTFSGISPTISSYQIIIEGDTDNVLTPFHTTERIDIALDTP